MADNKKKVKGQLFIIYKNEKNTVMVPYVKDYKKKKEQSKKQNYIILPANI